MHDFVLQELDTFPSSLTGKKPCSTPATVVGQFGDLEEVAGAAIVLVVVVVGAVSEAASAICSATSNAS